MVGYTLSLAVLLLLTKLPIDRSLLGSSRFDAFLAPPAFENEVLPIATRHETSTRSTQRASDPLVDPSRTVAADIVEEGEDTDIAEQRSLPGIERPLPARETDALSSSTNLVSLSATSKYMHTAISSPTVEDAPKLRIGTMLIDYPLSALKKAIQGLVIVRFVVETDGRAYGIDVVSGLEPECDAAVVNALRKARFVPGKSEGRRVPALSQIAVHFKIVDEAPWP